MYKNKEDAGKVQNISKMNSIATNTYLYELWSNKGIKKKKSIL